MRRLTAPIVGATKAEHLATAISALDFSLSDAKISDLEAPHVHILWMALYPPYRVRRHRLLRPVPEGTKRKYTLDRYYIPGAAATNDTVTYCVFRRWKQFVPYPG